MNELLDYLDELMLLSPELESELFTKALIWPDLKEGEILKGENIQNHVFFIKEGIISSNFRISSGERAFQLFGKHSFLFLDSFILPPLSGHFENVVRAYKRCKLIAISLQHFEQFIQLNPDMDELYYIAMRETATFQANYIRNATRRNGYQLLKKFSRDFPYLYKHTDPAELEKIMSLPAGLIPRLC